VKPHLIVWKVRTTKELENLIRSSKVNFGDQITLGTGTSSVETETAWGKGRRVDNGFVRTTENRNEPQP